MSRILLILTLVLGWAGAGMAGEASSLWPDIPKATGEPHPEGNEYWRKNHMKLMLHDRDLTMHQGDRQVQASLKKCFDCHAAKDEAGQVVTYASEKHFCRACHDYAAVRVDCFMCHRSTPEGVDETAIEHAGLEPGRGVMTHEAGSIIAYLTETAKPDAAGNGTEAGQ